MLGNSIDLLVKDVISGLVWVFGVQIHQCTTGITVFPKIILIVIILAFWGEQISKILYFSL